MTALSLTRLRLNHVLLGAAALLAAAAVWPWLAKGEADRPRPGAPEAAVEALTPLPPLSQFSATVERPLFSPTRRPAAAAVQTTRTAAPIESRYRLVGVVIVGKAQRAIVTEGGRRLDLGVGDTLEGFTVNRIEQNRLTLHSAGGEVVLTVKSVQGDAKPPK